MRWAAIEAVQRVGVHTRIGAFRDRVAQRRGRNQAKVAAARELVECVYYGLRDHSPPEQGCTPRRRRQGPTAATRSVHGPIPDPDASTRSDQKAADNKKTKDHTPKPGLTLPAPAMNSQNLRGTYRAS